MHVLAQLFERLKHWNYVGFRPRHFHWNLVVQAEINASVTTKPRPKKLHVVLLVIPTLLATENATRQISPADQQVHYPCRLNKRGKEPSQILLASRHEAGALPLQAHTSGSQMVLTTIPVRHLSATDASYGILIATCVIVAEFDCDRSGSWNVAVAATTQRILTTYRLGKDVLTAACGSTSKPSESLQFVVSPALRMEAHSVFIRIKSLGETQSRHGDLHSGPPDRFPRNEITCAPDLRLPRRRGWMQPNLFNVPKYKQTTINTQKYKTAKDKWTTEVKAGTRVCNFAVKTNPPVHEPVSRGQRQSMTMRTE